MKGHGKLFGQTLKGRDRFEEEKCAKMGFSEGKETMPPCYAGREHYISGQGREGSTETVPRQPLEKNRYQGHQDETTCT